MSNNLQISFEQQLTQLESDIVKQRANVEGLEDAIATLERGAPRPVDPKSDDIFNALRQLLGEVPQTLEEQRIHDAKLLEAKRTLQLAITSVQEKQCELDALRQQQEEQRQLQAFEEMKLRATEFNRLIDAAMTELEAMRGLAKIAGPGKFEVVADLNEQAYCQITANSVKLRRYFDIKRG